MDNLLFTTGIKYTFEEFQLFNNTIRKIRKLDIISNVMYVFLGVLTIASVIMAVQTGDVSDVVAFLPVILLFVFCGQLGKNDGTDIA